jgi:hypothetical protein
VCDYIALINCNIVLLFLKIAKKMEIITQYFECFSKMMNGFMKAWKYINEHKLKNSDRFYEIYENQYLNTYFADNGMPEGSLKEIDKEISEKVLLQYNKL